MHCNKLTHRTIGLRIAPSRTPVRARSRRAPPGTIHMVGTGQQKPSARPRNPAFSSGPCAKRPGWSAAALNASALGRSHRAAVGKAKLAAVIERSKALLAMPEDYRLAIVPGSGHGCRRDGAVVPAWPARGRHAGLGKLWQRLGQGCRGAFTDRRSPGFSGRLWRASGPDPSRSGARYGVYLERHHIRCVLARR